jgi:hypothetical protein
MNGLQDGKQRTHPFSLEKKIASDENQKVVSNTHR